MSLLSLPEKMSCDLKLGDLLELSKVYAPEYNMPELHDRVLVFDVMQDGWETHAILASSKHRDDSANVEENSGESSVTTSNEAQTIDFNGKSNLNEGKAVESISKTGIKAEIKQDVETGSTSGQDSGTENEVNNDSATVIVNDESSVGSMLCYPNRQACLSRKKVFYDNTKYSFTVHGSPYRANISALCSIQV